MAWETIDMKVAQNVEVESTDQSMAPPSSSDRHGAHPQPSEMQYSTIQSSHLGGAEAPLPAVSELENGREERCRAESKPLEDTSDIDEVIHLDVAKIPVKKLRVVVPRLRVACYLREEEICGKKKMKNMWNNKPDNWPKNVPFKDPNNKGTDGHKAGKEELVVMYEFLREIYVKMPRDDFVPSMPAPPTHHQSHGASHQPMIKEEQKPYPGTMIETSRPHPQIKQECASPQPMQQLPPTSLQAPPPQPQAMPTQAQATLPTRQEVSMSLGQETLSHFQRPGTPLYDLHERINNKLETVQIMVHNDQEALVKLQEVHQEIVEHLYQNAQRMEVCCAFLDAGHQFETLLDVVIAFGKEMALDVLRQGCQELLDKFAPQRDAQTQSSPHMQVFHAQLAARQAVSLAPNNGNHFIPTVASLAAKQQKVGPVTVNNAPQLKRDAPSPNTVAGLFNNLGLNMRTQDLQNVDLLSTIVETRDESQLKSPTEEGKDKTQDIFDFLMPDETSRKDGGSAKVVVEPTNLTDMDFLQNIIKRDVEGEAGDPAFSETLMNDVLAMEEVYSPTAPITIDDDNFLTPEMAEVSRLLAEQGSFGPSLTLNTAVNHTAAPMTTASLAANPQLAQTARVVSDDVSPINSPDSDMTTAFLNRLTAANDTMNGSEILATAAAVSGVLNGGDDDMKMQNFGSVPSYQSFTTNMQENTNNFFNQNLGSPGGSIPSVVVDYSDDSDPECHGARAGKRMRFADGKGTKGVKRLSHKGVKKGKKLI